MNQSKPLIFIHVPKTAGTSLRFMLCQQHSKKLPDDVVKWQQYHDPNVISDIHREINRYNNMGYISLNRLINFENRTTYNYNETTFQWSYILMPNVDIWKYWVNNVKDKSYNEMIELHLNQNPAEDYIMYPDSFEWTKCAAPDLCENEIYEDFNWITVLRNPVERVISEYYFCKYRSTPEYRERMNGIKVAERWWSHLPIWDKLSTLEYDDILEYSNLKESQNSQVKFLLGMGFLNDYEITEDDYNRLIDTMERLNFKVGIQEYMNETLNYFNKSFNLNMDYKSMTYERVQYNKPTVIKEIKQIIKDNNKYDFKLYNYFLNKMDRW